MSFFGKLLDVATGTAYGAITGDGFDITGKGAAARAQKDSLARQEKAAGSALDLQQRMYDESVARQKPFYDAGVTANEQRQKMLTGGYKMQESPAAQYALTQGTRSLNRQLAARGLLGSGNASQKLAELSSGVAAKDYGDQWQRLTDMVNTGTGAAQQSNQASSNMATQGTNTWGNLATGATNINNARAQLYTSMSPLKIGSDIAGSIGTMGGL